jgi:GntR family transcriptional regulator/MocR family aminotransferase
MAGAHAPSTRPAVRSVCSAFARVQRHTGQFVAPVMQLALAEFIERGHYRAHVRRMKAVYARRLAQFAELVSRQSGGALDVAIPAGGLQTMVTAREGLDETLLAKRLAAGGIFGQRLGDFHLAPEHAVHRGLLMGFSAWDEATAATALARLARMFAAR